MFCLRRLMLCVIGCVSLQLLFLFPGASLGYSVAPFGLGSPLFHRYYEGTTTSPFLHARLLWRLAVAYCRRIVWLCSLAVRCPRFASGRCSSGIVRIRSCFRQKTGDLPSSQGSLFMHLCRGLGPRWDVRRLGHLLLFAASRSVHAGSTARTPHNLKLSWLVPTALVLAVNASCQPHD
jgi:hypothetical protein